MKLIKRSAAALVIIIMLCSALFGCSRGIRGIDGIDWNEYDELIESIRAETDSGSRAQMLQRAEDMLMETECVTPLYGYRDAYLSKPELTGIFGTHYGAKYFMYADIAGDDKTITAYLGDAADSFDPALASTSTALTVAENTFSGLFAHDADGNVIPALAAECKCSDDGLIYTITLREGIVWSDGSSLGASDFIFSWRRAYDNQTGSPYKYLFDIIALTEDGKLDLSADETDTVLTVRLKTTCGYFTELCAFPAFYPVNEACVESAEGYMDIYDNIVDPDAWTVRANYVTSGAYIFSGTAEGKYIFKKNENFFDAENITVDTLELSFGTDADSAYRLYEAGDIDYLGVIPRDMHDELTGRGDYHADDVNGVYFLAYNFNCQAFSNMTADDAAQLRRAISLYIDRKNITDTVTKNGEGIATSVIPDGIPGSERTGHTASAGRGYFSSETEENRREAREIIKNLGIDEDGDGVLDRAYRFTLSYLTSNSPTDIAVAQSVQQDLAELGIMVKVTAAEERVFDFESGIYNYDIIALGAVSYYDDALSVLECWTTGAPGNYARLGSVVIKENENAY